MIPKIIHCCWFSGERKPALVRRCLKSWRWVASDFTIREWDVAALRTMTGGTLPPFVEAALKAKKWAFASDWARFAIIASEGGVYLDLDVELVKPLNDVIAEGPFFACSTDDPPWVDPGIGFSAEKGDVVCAVIARKYETMTFDPACHLNQACPAIVNGILADYPERRRLKAAVFNPKGNCAGRVTLTDETVAIHHYAASWFNWKQRLAYVILPRMGINVGAILKWVRG